MIGKFYISKKITFFYVNNFIFYYLTPKLLKYIDFFFNILIF